MENTEIRKQNGILSKSNAILFAENTKMSKSNAILLIKLNLIQCASN
ncbi:hypothetical protein [Nostoc sp. JL34]|nr:hypothetical protein [Nostoc sp. JL34]